MGKDSSRKLQRAIEPTIVTKHTIFIIGSVWVEPNSSAAGGRMLQLIEFFLSQKWKVFFGTTASKNENSIDLEALGVQEFSLELNDSSFDELIKKLHPTLVLFDRFMTEEQFGWRVAEGCPNAMRILDTEDLHCLRKTRQEAVKQDVDFQADQLLNSDITKREIAAVYRCDLSLIISTYEMQLLRETFLIDDSLLCHLPFFLNPISDETQQNRKSFEDRQHFVSIGNFFHAPNVDATLQLKHHIWPLVRKQLPNAQLHVYGAYPTQQVLQLNNEKEGFLVHGFAKDAKEVIGNSRVLLAPLRFGACIKGKLTDAMECGTPSVTTEIGAEGMHEDLPWNGFVESEWSQFAVKAVELYSQKDAWLRAQQNGIDIINTLYLKKDLETRLLDAIDSRFKDLTQLRTKNFVGQMLQHHTLKSTKYLSKWIEEKNKS